MNYFPRTPEEVDMRPAYPADRGMADPRNWRFYPPEYLGWTYYKERDTLERVFTFGRWFYRVVISGHMLRQSNIGEEGMKEYAFNNARKDLRAKIRHAHFLLSAVL